MFADDGVEARAIRQQRMQQKKSWPVAELRRVDGAVGEKSVHSSFSFKVEAAPPYRVGLIAGLQPGAM
jgi:hypothetical protein